MGSLLNSNTVAPRRIGWSYFFSLLKNFTMAAFLNLNKSLSVVLETDLSISCSPVNTLASICFRGPSQILPNSEIFFNLKVSLSGSVLLLPSFQFKD